MYPWALSDKDLASFSQPSDVGEDNALECITRLVQLTSGSTAANLVVTCILLVLDGVVSDREHPVGDAADRRRPAQGPVGKRWMV
jgi:hypothetical protein